jgi:aldose sugar dehydrogenase
LKRIYFCILIVLTLGYPSLIDDNFAIFAQQPTLRDPNLGIEIVYSGLNFPSDMAFFDANDILVLEKNTGIVKRIVNGSALNDPILDVAVANKDERGLLGIAIQRNESREALVFLYYTESALHKDGDDTSENREPLGNRLYSYTLVNNKLVDPKLLVDIFASTTANNAFHNGGKIVIGPDGALYLTVGNMERNTQSMNNKTGSPPDGNAGIIRVSQEGKPVGNGILGDSYPLNLYYAYGIRNSFGMDFDPLTGYLWDTENGPTYGDEINLVQAGFNSGSKLIYGIFEENEENFQPKRLEYFNGEGKYSNPEFVWNETVGPTALTFLNSSKLGSQYKNTMFVGDINNGNLYNFKLDKERKDLLLQKPLADHVADNNSELENTIFGKGLGGIIDLEESPDGYLYVLAIKAFQHNNEGIIYRISPIVQP